jgi:GntR family transcriptional regulator
LLIKRLYLHGNEPLALLHIYLPQNAREQAAALYSTDPTTETTYTMWEQKFGLRLKGASNTIRAIKADTENAEVLGLQIGDPILALERITYADDGRALDYIMLYHHWERYQFSVMIPRNNPKPS